MSRRFAWLAIAIIAATALYTAGWFYAAGRLEAATDAAIARITSDGGRAGCANRTARGYPFRIGLFCDEVALDDRDDRFNFRADGLRSAAQIYNPTHIVGELDEAWFDLFASPTPYGVHFEGIRFSTRIANPLPERISVTSGPISVDENPLSRGLLIVFSANGGETHLRRNGDDIDIAMSGEGISARAINRQIDVERFLADLTIDDGVRLAAEPPKSLRGLSATLRDVSVMLAGDARVAVSGPIAVDSEGLVNAKLQLTAHKPREIAAFLADLMPEQRGQITSVAAGLAALGETPSLPLTIVKGQARLAFVTLGDIPPLR